MKNKTKEQLIEDIKNYEDKIEELENDIDYWQKEHDDLYEELEALREDTKDVNFDNCINNLDSFIWKLKIDNYELFEKIDPFIQEYLKFYNN